MEMNMHRFTKKAKFLAGHDNLPHMRDAFKRGHNYVIDYSFIPLGYNCQKIYQPDPKIVAYINALNDNPLFYIYAGHGYTSSIDGIDHHKIIDSAANTLFPFMFSFACRTGNFASYACFGERFIRAKNKGGIAYLGSSVNTYNNSDVTLEKKIFGDAFLKDEQNLAVIINLGKRRFTYTSVSEKRKKRYIKAYNLLGDPSFDTKGIGCKQNFVFNNPEVFKSGAEITYRANYYIQNNNDFIIESGADVKLLAGNSIVLKPGFRAEAGSNVEIRILPCDDGTIQKSFSQDNTEGVFDNIERIIPHEIDEINFSLETDEIINPALFSVFPNPTTDDFSLAYTLENNSFVQINLYNSSGVFVKNYIQIAQQDVGVHYHNFSLSGLSSGLYIIVFKSVSKTISSKIIKH